MKPIITILSSSAIDRILDKNKKTLITQKGGPAYYIKECFRKMKMPVLAKRGQKIEVDILVNEKGEIGKIKKQPSVRKIDYSKILTPYILISTILDEWSLDGISKYKGKIFLDIQGYVRDSQFLNKKKEWESPQEIVDNIFCLKGTDEEIKCLPGYFLKMQKSKVLIITNGENGVDVWANGRKKIAKPSVVLKMANTIGAGDTFFANFLYFYIKTKNIYASAEYGVEKTIYFLANKEK